MTATQSTAGTAALVKGYRARIAADPDLYDGDVDVIMWLIEDTASRTWTPSEVAQVVKIDTTEARKALDLLVGEGHIASDERGCWTRYGARQR